MKHEVVVTYALAHTEYAGSNIPQLLQGRSSDNINIVNKYIIMLNIM